MFGCFVINDNRINNQKYKLEATVVVGLIKMSSLEGTCLILTVAESDIILTLDCGASRVKTV